MTEKIETVCSKCGKKHWPSEKNDNGIFYKYLRCNCGYQIDLNPRGPFTISTKPREVDSGESTTES